MVAKASVFFFIFLKSGGKIVYIYIYICIYIYRGEGTGVLGLGWEFLQVQGRGLESCSILLAIIMQSMYQTCLH